MTTLPELQARLAALEEMRDWAALQSCGCSCHGHAITLIAQTRKAMDQLAEELLGGEMQP